MKKNLGYLIVICGILSGCATQEKYIQQLQLYVGMSEEDLVSHMGPPNTVYSLNKNTKYTTYKDIETSYVPASASTSVEDGKVYSRYSGGYELTEWCDTTFTIKKGVVTNFSIKGNNCVAY